MKIKTLPRLRWFTGLATIIAALAFDVSAQAADANGTWSKTTPASTYSWGDTANWTGGIIATGSNMRATFTIPAAGLTITVTNDLNGRVVGNATVNGNSGTRRHIFIGQPLVLDNTTNAPEIATVSGGINIFSNVISGTTGLRLPGAGTVQLFGANNYSGGTTLAGGTLGLGNAAALGTGPLTNTGGSLTIVGDLNAGGGVTTPITLGADTTISCATNFQAIWAGTITNDGTPRTLTFSSTCKVTPATNILNARGYWGDTTLSSGASQFIRLILGTADALPTNGVLTIGSGSNGRPTWDLAGNNQTLAGLTTGTGGPITVTSSSGTPTLTISNINSAADYAFFGQNRNIGGSLMLVKTGAGRQQIGLTGAQGGTSYSGGTKILGGTLEAGVNGIGSGNVAITNGVLQVETNLSLAITGNLLGDSTATIDLNGGALTVSSGGNSDFQGAITNTGSLIKSGAGILTLSGASTFTGGITISNGAVVANSDTSLGGGLLTLSGGTLSNSVSSTLANNINLNTNVTVGAAATLTLSGAITNTGSLTKTGAGTLILSGVNTYSGTTTNSAGTLRVNGSLAGGAVQLNAGTLGGTGTIGGAVTLASGASIAPGASVGTLTLSSNLVLAGGGTLIFEVTNTASADKIIVGGDLNPSGVTAISLPNTATLTNGSYPLLEVTGVLFGTAANFSVTSPSVAKSYTVSYLTNTPNKVLLVVGDNSRIVAWTGSGGASSNVWDVNTSGNWTNLVSGAEHDVFLDNDPVTFDDGGITNPVVNITTTVSPTTTTVNASGNYTFTGSGGIAGTNSLTKAGTGTLTVSNANTFTGAVSVNAGAIVAANNTALGTSAGGVTVAVNATLGLLGGITVGSEALSLNSDTAGGIPALLNVGGTNTWSGDVAANTGTSQTRLNSDAGKLVLSGHLTSSGSGNLVLGGAGDGEVSGTISGPRGIFKSSTGTGTWTISGNNDYTGSSTISRGIMYYTGSLTNAAGAFTVNNAKLNISGAINSGGGTWTVGSTSNAVVNINSGAVVTITNYTSGTAAGVGAALNVSGGSLATFPGTSISVGSLGYGSFNLSGGTVNTPFFQMANGSGTSVGLITGGTLTVNNSFLIVGRSGTGTLTVAPGGTVNCTTATNLISIGHATGGRGELNLTGGTINNPNQAVGFGSGVGTTTIGSLNLDAGNLIVNRLAHGDGTNRMNFSGALLQVGGSSTNIFIPATLPAYINGAFDTFAGGAVIDTAGFDVTNGASLQTPTGNGVSSIAVLAGANQGSGYIGAPYVQVNTTGTGFGATAIADMVDDGTGNGTLKVSAIHITNPGTDYNSGVVTATFVGGAPTTAAIAEVGVTAANTSGGLVKLGAGILTMTNLNTYTGSTVVSNGTLRLEQTNYSPVITVKSGATLGGNGFLRSVAVEAGGTLAPGASVGTLSLTNLTLAATATSSFEFNGNVANDLVNVGGDLTPGGSTITITNISANPMPRGYYRLINYLGTKNGSFGPVQLLGSSGMTVGLDEVTANQVNLVVSNNLPVPGSTTYTQTSGMSLKISITNLLSHVTDVDAGDTGTLSLVSVSPTTNTVTLTINGDKIEVPVSTVADQFTYTVEDGHGGTNSGTVNISIQLVTGQPATLTVSGGTATGVFYGVPTLQYVVQRSTNLVDWVAISTNTVPASGVFTNIDTFGDLNPPPPPYPSAAYYQLQSH